MGLVRARARTVDWKRNREMAGVGPVQWLGLGYGQSGLYLLHNKRQTGRYSLKRLQVLHELLRLVCTYHVVKLQVMVLVVL